MTKSGVILVLALLLGGVGLYAASNPGGISVGGLSLGGKARAYLRDRTLDFLEDIKFKDFDKAATYHLPSTQKERDIPALIRRVFRIKHEVLDIHQYDVLEVDFDRSSVRARVRALIKFRIIGDKRVRDDKDAFRDTEMLFYWFKQPDGQWVMELESSLRR